MECSRCRGAAVVKRESAFYCGKCALARDWEEVILLVQEAYDGTRSAPEEEVVVAPSPAPVAANAPADPFSV